MRMQSATIPTSSSSILSSASRERRQFRNKFAVDDYHPPLELPLRWRDPPQLQHSNRALPPPQTTATEARLTQLQSLSPMDAAKQGHSISSNHNSTFRSTSCFSSLQLDFALVPTARAEPKLAADFNSTVNPKECTQSDGMQESDSSSAEEDSNLGAQHSDMVVLDAKASSDVQVISAQVCISSPTMLCGDVASTVPLQPLVQEVLDSGLEEATEALAVQTAKQIDQHMMDHGDGETELNDNYNVGIGNNFTACVEMPGLNLAEKVDPTPCSQTTRCNVADDFRTHIPTFSLPPHHHVFPASLTVLQPNHEFFFYVGIFTDIQFGRLLLVMDTIFCIDDADKLPELAGNIRRVDVTNFNDPLLERGFMGNSYGDSLSIQKAYIGALLQQQIQFGMPFLGKSSYYNSPFCLGMSYQESPLASPHLSASPVGLGSPLRHGERNMHLPSGMRNLVGVVMDSWHLDGGGNIHDGFASSLMEEFKNNNTKCYELSDIARHVVEFSADQYGSRFIQQKLETASAKRKDMVFGEIMPHAFSLMTDVFGNYVVHKFFEHGSSAQRNELAYQLTGYVLTLSLQMYGYRVIQKAIEFVDLGQQTKMVKELDGHIMRYDQNGSRRLEYKVIGVSSMDEEHDKTTWENVLISLSCESLRSKILVTSRMDFYVPKMLGQSKDFKAKPPHLDWGKPLHVVILKFAFKVFDPGICRLHLPPSG